MSANLQIVRSFKNNAKTRAQWRRRKRRQRAEAKAATLTVPLDCEVLPGVIAGNGGKWRVTDMIRASDFVVRKGLLPPYLADDVRRVIEALIVAAIQRSERWRQAGR